MTPIGWGARMRNVWDRWQDLGPALALTALGQYEFWLTLPDVTSSAGRVPVAVGIALTTMSLAWRRRLPTASLCVASGAFVASALLINAPLEQGPLAVFITMIGTFFSAGLHAVERWHLGGVVAALATIVVADVAYGVFEPNRPGKPLGWLILAGSWLLGREFWRRRQDVLLLSEKAHQVEVERLEDARHAVDEERGRIARELHDVIAHGVSVMIVQAQAGPRLASDARQTRATFVAIETAGREALTELRRLLRVLRTGGGSPDVAPQPSLRSLDSLLQQVRDAGLTVGLSVTGDPAAVPPGIDLCAYRIIQEALTNSLKHAAPAHADIRLRYDATALEFQVLDDGIARPDTGGHPGHGLIGMRERAALYGGSLEAGPMAEGGYVVRARLPLSSGGS